MSNEKQSRVDQVVEVFRASVTETYELDSAIVDNLCGFVRAAEKQVALPAGRRVRATSSKPKKARRKSAYNVYVREMMKDAAIKDMDHRSKMGAIAELWKKLSDEEKGVYKGHADQENATVETTADSAVESAE